MLAHSRTSASIYYKYYIFYLLFVINKNINSIISLEALCASASILPTKKTKSLAMSIISDLFTSRGEEYGNAKPTREIESRFND